MSSIKDKLDLDKVPHYTTLQKFVSRIPSSWFNLILSKTLIRQSNKSRKSECYVMDKGYDSEEIHALTREEIKADLIQSQLYL